MGTRMGKSGFDTTLLIVSVATVGVGATHFHLLVMVTLLVPATMGMLADGVKTGDSQTAV